MKITNEQINDLVVCALEGGINYWCNDATVTTQPIGTYEYASDVISMDGIITITDDCGNKHELNKEKFLKGIEKAMKNYDYETFEELFDNHDEEITDVIIQYAIFDEIIYG